MSQVVKCIDFLPDKYRQATKRRRTSYWRGAVALMFAGVFAASAGGVTLVRRDVGLEHQQVSVKHAAATAADAQLKQKEARLAELRTYAELVTFLRHPWPRSRILGELFAALPASVTLDKLRIVAEARPAAAGGEVGGEATPETAKTAATDLAELRRTTEAQDVVVRLEGTTADQPALHAYVQRLGGNRLFLSADVEQIEAVRENNVRTSRFTLRVVVRPGWGLPGGPTPEELPSATIAHLPATQEARP
jgi:Tfp pilus assembly protein PilN